MKNVPDFECLNISLNSDVQAQPMKHQLNNLTKCMLRVKKSLVVLLLMLLSTVTFAQNWDQVIKAAASDRAWRFQADRAVNDYFGTSVAIDGNYAVVGATFDEDLVPGSSIFNNGSALLFKKDGSGQWQFLKKLKATDFGQLDDFGCSVAISGNTIVIGARLEDQDAAGGSTLNAAGSVYVFSKDQGGTDNWGQVKKIVASDRDAGDEFGFSVSISGSTIVVGAVYEDVNRAGEGTFNEPGAAYVFDKDQGGVNNWGQVKKILASDRLHGDFFGSSVSISGNTIVIGAYGQDYDAAGANLLGQTGAAYVFSKDAGGTNNWGQIKKLVADVRSGDERFGWSSAISGNNIVVGAFLQGEAGFSTAGAVYVYSKDQGGADNWGLLKKIIASDRTAADWFGYSVAMNGNTLVVGATREAHNALGGAAVFEAGSVYVFSKDEGGADNWGQTKKIVASDRAVSDFFGWSVSVSGSDIISGAYLEDEDDAGLNTLNAAGAAYIFNSNQGGTANWGQVIKLVPKSLLGNLYYGGSVSIDGDYAVVGAYGEDKDAAGLNSRLNAGAVYVLKKQAGVWTEVKKLVASDRAVDDYFGINVAISGNTIIVGAYLEDEDAAGGSTVLNAGSAYVFSKDAGGVDNWGQVKKLVASDRAANDRFGIRVSISGSNIVVGATAEDEDASGTNTLSGAGAAYVFNKDAGGTDNWGQVKKLVASDRAIDDNFGNSLAISSNLIVVGVNLEDEDASGNSTLSNAGSAYIFSIDAGGTNNWGQVKKLVASDRAAGDNFGYSIGISGNNIVVSAYLESEDASGGATLANAGSAYVFNKDAGGVDNWGQVKKLVTSDRAAGDIFGISVAISGNNIVVGAFNESEDASGGNTLSLAGSAYVFSKDQGGINNWGQVQKIVASDRGASDRFGASVTINGGNIIVGVSQEDEDAGGANTITSSGSVYVFVNLSVVLPVSLGSFTTEKQQNNALVQWSTLQEQNTQHFTVQHSTDGNNWKDLSTVQAKGNSQVIQRYKYTHTNPSPGLNYYRLQMVDLDGTGSFSDIGKVMMPINDGFRLYPNPVQNGIVTVTVSEATTVQVYNQQGNLLMTRNLPVGNTKLDLKQLPKGMYVMRSLTQVYPFIIQ
jgi:hypothetical protein